jgi:hypothetical protein
MLRTIFFFLLFTMAALQVQAQELYQYTALTSDGNGLAMQQFKGQKLVLVTLSPDPADSMHLQLIAFAKRHGDSIKIIGLTAWVEGEDPPHFEKIRTIYADGRVILLKPAGLSKLSATEQPPLIQWLTNSRFNHHFDKDAVEPETRFFIDESGRLYSVLSKHAGWDTPFIRQVLAARPPRSF